jgi:long-subunit acyl-CoA synthetase (AMP-forming)
MSMAVAETDRLPGGERGGRAWTVFGQDTLPKLFRHVVAERGDRVALREKELGIWRAITWRE